MNRDADVANTTSNTLSHACSVICIYILWSPYRSYFFFRLRLYFLFPNPESRTRTLTQINGISAWWQRQLWDKRPVTCVSPVCTFVSPDNQKRNFRLSGKTIFCRETRFLIIRYDLMDWETAFFYDRWHLLWQIITVSLLDLLKSLLPPTNRCS